MKILVVDDSGVQRKMIIKVIQAAGFSNPVLEASNGQEAVQILGVNFKDVSLILCDWNMPVMDGYQFLLKNKQEQVFTIPIFMMTTENSEEKIRTAMELGAIDYIMKPFTMDILENKIRMLNELLG